MKYKWIAVITVIVVVALLVSVFSGFFGQSPLHLSLLNKKPSVAITYPSTGATVSSLVMISGTASSFDSKTVLTKVEVKIGDGDWVAAVGTALWSFDWNTYTYEDGSYSISARSFSGNDASDAKSVTVSVQNPTSVDSGTHKWAIFITAANFPENNQSKLGNGGLSLSENIASYLIKNDQYATSHIMLLFDDGWVRSDNGLGHKEKTLQQRQHQYDIIYGGATKANVLASFKHLINESNKYKDSEVFIWVFNHGLGDVNNTLTGGKLLERSEIFLWDGSLTDKQMGDLLAPLKSKKVAIIVDACYAGGFADKTILNHPTFFLLRSGLPQNGRIVISATSKFRPGYASTTQGPLFSLLWFEGFSTGKADGFRPGLFDRGVPTHLRIFKDGKVSVEEAFYYASYMLRTDDDYKDYKTMQPQMNDEYPHRGLLLSRKEMVLGQ